MKRLSYVAQTTFLLLGTVIGSGFLSGREIVSFFGKNIFFYAPFAGVLFFFTTYILLTLGGKYGSLEEGNRALFGRAERTVNAALGVCLFSVVAASLAMIDSMVNSLLGIDGRIPAASLVTLGAAVFFAKKGIGGVKKLNAVLVPAMLAVTLAFLFARGRFDFGAPLYPSRSGAGRVCFYVGFNMFLSAAVIARAGSTDKKSVFWVSLLTAAVSFALILLIYGAVNYEGANAAGEDLPLVYLFSKSPAQKIVFGIVLYLGALTTAVCSWFPLAETCKRLGGFWNIAFPAGAFALSRFGVKFIVGRVYPAAGVLGAAYFVFAFAAEAYKKRKKGKIKG